MDYVAVHRWQFDGDDEAFGAQAASFNDRSLRAVADEYAVSMSHCMALLSQGVLRLGTEDDS